MMTENEKNECRENGYTCDSNGNFKACRGDCENCSFSYDYVTGYHDGYHDCYMSEF